MKKEQRPPGDTTQETREDAEGFLALSAVIGSGSAIENQEAGGQRSFVNSDTLPTDIGRYAKYSAKAILEKMGIKFLGVVESDPMFQYVELPLGWKKVPTDHSMWSRLVDDKGRERATIFYKAAFYDRSAHMVLSRRFNVGQDYDREKKEGVAVANVMDCGVVIFTTPPLELPADRSQKYEVGERAVAAGVAWLNENYPDWGNPAAYWD